MRSTSSDALRRFDLGGPAMGTCWRVQFWRAETVETGPLLAALQEAVATADRQMSLWKSESDICRLNKSEPGAWVTLGSDILHVLECALSIGRRSGGAFDIAVGEAVSAWGFGPEPADPQQMRSLMGQGRARAADVLELDTVNRGARRHGPARFDLNGIAKGYAVDRLVEVARSFGIGSLVAELDGDLRCAGTRPDGSAWPVAVELPDFERRAAHSLLELSDLGVATSGDYRHWIEVGAKRFSHTIHPFLNAPLGDPPASVTVLAETGMEADAWATALMVLGEDTGRHIARANDLHAIFLRREKRAS